MSTNIDQLRVRIEALEKKEHSRHWIRNTARWLMVGPKTIWEFIFPTNPEFWA